MVHFIPDWAFYSYARDIATRDFNAGFHPIWALRPEYMPDHWTF
jgi:hypothetical protein